MKLFGLIGKTLKHSFSKKYFGEKFESEGINECKYELYELESIEKFTDLIQSTKSELAGLNVTIPYKKEVMVYLDELDDNAAAIDAVNTIKVLPDGNLKGYNTDYFGFRRSLEKWNTEGVKALILGTGGASNAVRKVLSDLNISYTMVSRSKSDNNLSYEEILQNPGILAENHLIINTTPLGTFPEVNSKPDLPYQQLTEHHMLFDLVYNPEVTAFLNEGKMRGAQIQNGYDMLVGQAEASWEIWNH